MTFEIKDERMVELRELLLPETGPVWLRVGTLLDGEQKLRDAHLVYDAETIRYVGEQSAPAELVKTGQGEPDAILPEHTVLPGLIEAHAHLFLEGGELDLGKRQRYLEQSPSELLEQAQGRLEKLVRMGIAGIRDAGDRNGVGLALAKQYAGVDRPVMPYLDSPGAAIYRKGRYGSFMGDPLEECPSLKECVESRIQAGAHRIKIIPTGIINFKEGKVTARPQMTAEEVAEIVGAAKVRGKQTFAHASGDEGIEVAITGGVDSVEHGFFVRDDQLMRMRDRGIAWVPTFAPVQEQVDHAKELGWSEGVIGNLRRILDQHSASLLKAHGMGVQIVAGSDAGSCGVPHGFGLMYELELMEKTGMPAVAVVNAATGNSSRRLGFGERFGQIRAGYKARFIITGFSPMETVKNLRKEKAVLFDGRLYQANAGRADCEGL